jgi:hypothetical protein
MAHYNSSNLILERQMVDETIGREERTEEILGVLNDSSQEIHLLVM